MIYGALSSQFTDSALRLEYPNESEELEYSWLIVLLRVDFYLANKKGANNVKCLQGSY